MFGAIRRLASVAIAWAALTIIVGLAVASQHYDLAFKETWAAWDADFWLPFRMSCTLDSRVECLDLIVRTK